MTLLYVMFYCAFVTFPYGVVGQVLYLIVSITDLSFLFKYLTLLEITTHLTRVGVEYKNNPYNNLPQEDGHIISYIMNSSPQRWTTTHLTGRPLSTSKVAHDMIPKRMITTHLIVDTAHRILGNDWSYTCWAGPVSNGVIQALLREHRSPGLRPTSHEIWVQHT